MRLSYVLLAAAVAALNAISVANGATISEPTSENIMGLVNAQEGTRNDRRYLKMHQEDEFADDKKEERMFSGWGTSYNAVKTVAKLAKAKSFNSRAAVLKQLEDAEEIKALFAKFEPQLKKLFPEFENGMPLDDFMAMVMKSKSVTEDQQLLAISAYSKYVAVTMP